ncbi:hypothetical protein LZ190_25375, partial [Rhodovulum sulfidophilum]|nr:hypothetical protein [Rhodovulum sulfidophilum]
SEELCCRAIAHLQSVPVGGVASYLRDPLAAEILVATKAIMKATAKARRGLAIGDMSGVE